MFFLNLSLGEFLTILTSLSAIVAALYLLDKSQKRHKVSTLRFWVDRPVANEQRNRKQIREPWSLLLQLLSLLLLLLAVAQLEWGTRRTPGRSHVVVLDVSSRMAQQVEGRLALDLAKDRVRAYLARIPEYDPVMLIRAAGLATPATTLSSDRKKFLETLAASRPSYSALDISAALHAANRAGVASSMPSEVVFVGGNAIARKEDASFSVPNLRFVPVPLPGEGAGIVRLSVRQDVGRGAATAAPPLWVGTVSIHNYGQAPLPVTLGLRYGASTFAPRKVMLPPGGDATEEYRFSASGSGNLHASLSPADSLPLDNEAEIHVPSASAGRMLVYSARAALWRPLFDADQDMNVSYLGPADYKPSAGADVVLLDGFLPPALPADPSILVMPPSGRAPVRVVATRKDVKLTRWNSSNEQGAGLYSKQLAIPSAQIYAAGTPDSIVASTDDGPVVVTGTSQSGNARFVQVGFDPLAESLRYEVATPLLFANLLRWLDPGGKRDREFTATEVGVHSIPLGADESGRSLRVVDSQGFNQPFTIRDRSLQVYVDTPQVIRVRSAVRDRLFSLTLPEVARYTWSPPSAVPRGLPGSMLGLPASVSLWKWLAALGGIGLLIEWLIYGRKRMDIRLPAKPKAAEEPELVNK